MGLPISHSLEEFLVENSRGEEENDCLDENTAGSSQRADDIRDFVTYNTLYIRL